MRPMFRYFGGKWLKAKHYGPPTRKILVEPFAGAANYSLFWDWTEVVLVEKDPVIYGIWDWLINEAKPCDFDMVPDDNWRRDELWGLPKPLKDLVGMWYHLAAQQPGRTMAPRYRKERDEDGYTAIWGRQVKARLKKQLPKIKDWQIIHGDYTLAPDGPDYFSFIDPPYQKRGGESYVCNSKEIDFKKLGEWCRGRNTGIVCESIEAEWLPFEKFREVRNQAQKMYTEAVYWINPGQPVFEDE